MKTNIRQLIDFEKVDALLEGFNKSTGFVTAILDLEGNILSRSGWRQICTEFHRLHPATSGNCAISDAVLANKMKEGEPCHLYHCLNGLVDVAVPLMIQGEHVANLFSGQFFFEQPDKEAFKSKAVKYGFDEQKYIEALEQVPVISKEKVKHALDFLLQMVHFISDLSYQKKELADLTEQLTESEQRLALAIRHPSMIFAQTDRDLRYTWIPNPHPDFQTHDIIGKRDDEIANNDGIRQLIALKQSVLDTGKSGRMEIAFPLSGGNRIYDIIAEPVFNDNGQVVEVNTFSLDITDRKRAEEASKRSEERFRIVQDVSPDGFTILAPVKNDHGEIVDFEWIYENETIAAINGTKPAEVSGKRLLDLFPEHAGTPLFDAYLQVAATGQTQVFDEVYVGEIIAKPTWLRLVIVSMGEEIGILAQNISERKQADMELSLARENAEESNANITAIIEGTADSIWAFDKGYTVLYLNNVFRSEFRESFGVELEKGVNLADALPDFLKQIWKPRYERVLLGERFTITDEVETAQGKQFIQVIFNPIVKQGEVIGGACFGTNITGRMLAEEAFRRKEKDLKESQRIAHVGSWRLDVETNQVEWTDELYRMYGFDPDSPPPPYTEHRKLFTAQSWDRLSAALAQTASVGIPYTLELETIRKDGSNGWMWVHGEADLDPDGKIIGLWGVAQDISERKKVEETVRETNEYLDNLFNYANAPIIVWDTNFNITRFNQAFEELTGLKSQEVLGKHIEILFPPESRNASLELIQKALSGEYWKVIEIDIAHVNGQTRTLIWNSANISNPEGNIIATIAQGQDITERKRAEEALRQSNEYLDNLFNYANAPIIVWDTNFNITRFNQAFEELTGLKSQKVLGKHIEILFPPESRNASLELIQKALSGEYWKVIEIDIAHLNGQTRTLIWNSANIRNPEGNIIATIAQGQDITERKRAEEALLESEDRFKSLHNASFGGIAIHNKGIILDCNQGLSAMTGYTVDELIGMNGLLLIAESSRDLVLQNIQSGYEQAYEALGVRKNGEEYPLRLEARNIHYKGMPVRTVEFRDITEIKQAEKELIVAKETAEKNEEKFRKAVLTIPDAITINRLNDGVYITANEGFYKTFGYNEGEVIGKSSHDLNIWVDNSQRKVFLSLLEQQGRIENFETRFLSKTGTVFDCLVSSSIILIEGVEHTINITKDITYLKNIESQLISAKERAEESEMKFREMARLMPQIIFETDTIGRLTYANKQAHNILGYPEDFQILGLSSLDFYIPEDRKRAVENIQRKLQGQAEGNNEYTMIRKDGSLIDVLVFSNPITKDNKVIGLRGVIVDITQRKMSEELLRESERKYRLLAENSSDVIWTLDNEFRFTYISPSIYSLRGYTPEEAMRESIGDTMPPHSLKIVQDAIAKGHELDEDSRFLPVQVEIEQYHKNGGLVWVGISVQIMLNEKGEQIGLIGISRDITQRKQAEEALRKNEYLLRELNAQKDKFFTIISHDLKSPFNAIYALSQHLVDQMQEKDYEGVEQYASFIEESSKRAMNLLTNLFEWSQAQSGRMAFEPEPFELVEFIEENSRLYEDIAREKSVKVIGRLPNRLLVHADKHMVSTIIRNLITNAIKFSHPGSEVIIAAERGHKEVTVLIKDNGVGIPNERLKKLFRIDETESTKGTANEKGTGLGLIICKEFVDKHGGRIWVESQLGKGTTFYFTLPGLV